MTVALLIAATCWVTAWIYLGYPDRDYSHRIKGTGLTITLLKSNLTSLYCYTEPGDPAWGVGIRHSKVHVVFRVLRNNPFQLEESI